MPEISQATTKDDLDAVRDLVREFSTWAIETISGGVVPTVFSRLDDELARLPGKFAPPSGALLLARVAGRPAGCVGFFRRDAVTMEVKRMYVRPEFRGQGVGESLIVALLEAARQQGYRRYILSSHVSMLGAHRIYARAGFSRIDWTAEFEDTDGTEAICMEMLAAD